MRVHWKITNPEGQLIRGAMDVRSKGEVFPRLKEAGYFGGHNLWGVVRVAYNPEKPGEVVGVAFAMVETPKGLSLSR